MMIKKTRGMLLVGVFMIAGMALLNKTFYGSVAARLPFEPWKMFQGLTHYGIENPDTSLCSVTFIFVLANLSLGTYLKKTIGLEGPRISQPNQAEWLNGK